MRGTLLLLSLIACGSVVAEPSGGASGGTSTPVTTSDAGVACPSAGAVETSAPIASTQITEPSGIAVSKINAGVLWTHNDSGDSARAFAVDRTGALRATLVFDSAPAVDIEDMAIEDADDGSSFLYFGDIGDNGSSRREVVIHRVREPLLAAGTTSTSLTATSEKMTVHYADGPHNAETLLFDPVTQDLFIATKVVFGNSAIHRIGAFAAGTAVTSTRIASVPVALATGGAISRDGALIAIRTALRSGAAHRAKISRRRWRERPAKSRLRRKLKARLLAFWSMRRAT